MTTFEQVIQEMPLPATWDKSYFTLPGRYGEQDFLRALLYANEHSKYVAKGSSRAVFKLTYEGRPTVLKIAMNKVGLAQNKGDVKIVFGKKTKSNPLVCPGIDYDTQNPSPLWVHLEFATPVSEDMFERDWKVSVDRMVTYVEFATGAGREKLSPRRLTQNFPDVNPELPIVRNLIQLVIASGTAGSQKDGFISDVSSPDAWGKYHGKYVIVDFGYSESVYKMSGVRGATNQPYQSGDWPPDEPYDW